MGEKFRMLQGDPHQCHLMLGLMHLIERNDNIYGSGVRDLYVLRACKQFMMEI